MYRARRNPRSCATCAVEEGGARLREGVRPLLATRRGRRGAGEGPRPSGAAVGGGAAEHDVVRGHLVAGAGADGVDGAFELGVLERAEAAAAVADRVVVVVVARRVGALIPGRAADVRAMHQ